MGIDTTGDVQPGISRMNTLFDLPKPKIKPFEITGSPGGGLLGEMRELVGGIVPQEGVERAAEWSEGYRNILGDPWDIIWRRLTGPTRLSEQVDSLSNVARGLSERFGGGIDNPNEVDLILANAIRSVGSSWRRAPLVGQKMYDQYYDTLNQQMGPEITETILGARPVYGSPAPIGPYRTYAK